MEIPSAFFMPVSFYICGHIEESIDINKISDGNLRKQDNGFIVYVLPFQSSERKKIQ